MTKKLTGEKTHHSQTTTWQPSASNKRAAPAASPSPSPDQTTCRSETGKLVRPFFSQPAAEARRQVPHPIPPNAETRTAPASGQLQNVPHKEARQPRSSKADRASLQTDDTVLHTCGGALSTRTKFLVDVSSNTRTHTRLTASTYNTQARTSSTLPTARQRAGQ